MRIFTAGIVTETNTFSPIPTGLADFDVIRPADLNQEGGRKDPAIEVFRQKAAEGGHEFIFSFSAFAQPAGLTVKNVYEQMRDELLEDLQAALPVDIVLLPLHGAMVASGYDDCEGDLISRVRQVVGPDVVIGVELDLHCHLTEQMVADADLIVIYKEYPHTDIALRAAELFDLAVNTAEGQIKPTMALFDCRMIGLYLTPVEPMRLFVDEMSAAEGKDGVLSLSLAHCFPWGDVPECGTRMLAMTDNNSAQAVHVAERFGRKFYKMRQIVSFKPLSLDEALEKALSIQTYPVVIADQADNAGGGAPSDSTFVLKALLEHNVTNAALGMMYDPVVVQLAKSAGDWCYVEGTLRWKNGRLLRRPSRHIG